jgi:hypothetical protein
VTIFGPLTSCVGVNVALEELVIFVVSDGKARLRLAGLDDEGDDLTRDITDDRVVFIEVVTVYVLQDSSTRSRVSLKPVQGRRSVDFPTLNCAQL